MQEQTGNFGRPEMLGGMETPDNAPNDMPEGGSGFGGFAGFGGGMGDFFNNMGSSMTEYVTEIDSATNLTVVFQLMGVGILLTLISSLFAIVFVLRYDPLKIMANRE